MAGLSSFYNPTALGVNSHFDDDSDTTATSNVDGGATTLTSLTLMNNANAAVTYFKMYNSGAPVVGTTAPDWQFPLKASTDETYLIKDGGVFSVGLSWCSSDSGGTAAGSNPGTAIDVYATTTVS